MADKPTSLTTLEILGRVRLSRSFFMREFLYSEVANLHGIPNIPDDPDLAIEAGKHLCEELLEPLTATFGRVVIRSAYRSSELNAFCNGMQQDGHKGYSCASNDKNFGRHIWDMLDSNGQMGAMACIVIPWFADRCAEKKNWQPMAYWIHDHLPYSELEFYPNLLAFNIGWHEKPKRTIYSYIDPKGYSVRDPGNGQRFDKWYEDFPSLKPAEVVQD